MFAAFNGAEPDGQPLQESLAEIAKGMWVCPNIHRIIVDPIKDHRAICLREWLC